MTEDEKIFLEFMDYLAFEEYQEQQKKAKSFNGLYNYDDTDLLTDHHYSAPVKTTLPKQNAHNTPRHPILHALMFLFGTPLIAIIIFNVFGACLLTEALAFIICWKLICKLSD